MIQYPMREGKYGPIYDIAKQLKLSETKSGTWCLDYSPPDPGNRRRRRCKTLEEGIEKGEQLAMRLGLKPCKAQESPAEKPYTLDDAKKHWMDANRTSWKKATMVLYEIRYSKHIAPVLGTRPIQEITLKELRNFMIEKLKTNAPNSVNGLHAILSGIFEEAIVQEKLTSNPSHNALARLLPKQRKRTQRKPDFFAAEDLELFISTAKTLLKPDRFLVIQVLAYTGMRIGECLAIHRDNLDTVHNFYTVQQTLTRYGYGEPKTDAGERTVDLPPALVAEMKAHCLRLQAKALESGVAWNGYLFGEMTHATIRSDMEKVCRRVGLRVRKPHDLRHTYASLLLEDEHSPVYVQRQLGHEDIRTTVGTYGHKIPKRTAKDLSETLRIAKKFAKPTQMFRDEFSAT